MPYIVTVGEVEVKRSFDKGAALVFAQRHAQELSEKLGYMPANGTLGPDILYSCTVAPEVEVRVIFQIKPGVAR